MTIRHRILLSFLLVVAVLAGCSNESAQRSAFIEFLQTRVLDKPGLHVPKLTDEEKKSLGEYAGHYAVMADFNDNLTRISKPMGELLQKGSFTSMGEVVARQGEIKQVKAGFGKLRAEIDTQLAQADSARAALKQPAELKTVYDQAFDKTVTVPANTFREVFPAIDGTLDRTLAVADYIQTHPNRVRLQGATVMVTDPAAQSELNQLLARLQASGAALTTAQQRLQAMVRGG